MLPLTVFLLMLWGVDTSVPPTLPHGHASWEHEPLHINSVKEVIETFDKMWHNYTLLHSRNVEAERHLVLAEERVSSALAVCGAEKRALVQICDLRMKAVAKEECFKDIHAKIQNHTEENEEHREASCACKLTACEHGSVAELTRQFLTRLDDIWHSKSMFLVSSDAKAELTLTAIQWAKDEFDIREKRDADVRANCSINQRGEEVSVIAATVEPVAIDETDDVNIQ